MQTHKISQNSFKGYDARPLKGFLMSYDCFGIAREMQAIGNREGFKIFTVDRSNIIKQKCKEGLPKYSTNTVGLWAQDLWTIVKGKLLASEESHTTIAIKEFFSLHNDFTQKILRLDPKYINEVKKIWNLFFPEGNKHQGSRISDMEIARIYDSHKNNLKNMQENIHIAGGNIFIVRGNKEDEVIVGNKELDFFSIEDIKAMYKVEKVTTLPQMDYHLDLFIRPLDKKRILLTDDKLTLETLNKGIQKLDNFILELDENKKAKYLVIRQKMQKEIEKFEILSNTENRPNINKVSKKLKKNGFNVIRVPGRFYNDILTDNNMEYLFCHVCNYINANVLKNKDNELIYITNKSDIDEILGLTPEISKAIDFSFEEEFIKSIEPYVNRKHIYFISGDRDYVAKKMLYEFLGGIHCACTEIPHGVKINPEVINDSSK